MVSLQRGDEANEPLNAIATAGKGTVLTTADPAALTAAFAKEADALARQIVVTAEVPAGFKRPARTSRSPSRPRRRPSPPRRTCRCGAPPTSRRRRRRRRAAAGERRALRHLHERDVRRRRRHRRRAARTSIVVLPHGPASRPPNLTLTEQIQAYGVMAVPGSVRPPPRRRTDGARRPGPPGGREGAGQQQEPGGADRHRARGRRAATAAGRVAAPACRHRRRRRHWSACSWAPATSSSACWSWSSALVGPWLYLKVKRTKRLKAFGTACADTLQLMSGSLSAGLVPGAVHRHHRPRGIRADRQRVPPRGDREPARRDLEDSMEGVAERMESRDFGWVVMAIRIQREVGGNLAELLLTVAATLREREYLRRHVRALSAEGRLSATSSAACLPASCSTSPCPSPTTSSRCTPRRSAGSS